MMISLEGAMYEDRKVLVVKAILGPMKEMDDNMIVAIMEGLLEAEGLGECVMVKDSLRRSDDGEKIGILFYPDDSACTCDDCKSESTAAVSDLLEEMDINVKSN